MTDLSATVSFDASTTADDWIDLVDCAMKYEQRGAVTTEGVFSHLSVAENATRDAETNRQIRLFDAAVEAARRVGLNPRTIHSANTAAARRRPDLHYDMVRIGIGTYGLSPLRQNERVPIKLRRALSMHATLSAVKQLPADHGVSYGARHITSRPTLVGLVPVGYGDGLPISADGIAVTIHGVTHPALGVISMDQMVIGLSNDAGLSGAPMPGDEVTIIALDGENTVDQWATASSSSNYEIVTKLTRRPARVYRSP